MVAHFTIYLPPPVLSPLPLDPKSERDLPLKLHQLPASSHNWSRSLDPRRHNLLLSTQGSSRAGHSILPIARDYGRGHGDDVGSIEAGGDLKGKRKATSQEVEFTQDSTVSTRARKTVEYETSLENGHTQLNGSIAQRRSRRLSRANDSLLGSHLGIGLGTTESFLSLNTTISDTSLLPPTNPENSVYNLPQWHVPLSKLVTLQSLLQASPRRQSTYGKTRKFVDQGGGMGGQKVNLIACVTAVEAFVLRQRKEEKARGREGTLYIGKWSVVAPPTATNGGGNQAEVGCEVKLWDSCAREWGDDTVRRGDVVMLENAEFRPASEKDKAHIVLSPSLLSTSSPKPTILYRTLPRYRSVNTRSDHVYPGNKARGATRHMEPEDRALRPDLRLARSDPGLRRVVDVARWFAGWVEGEPPL